MAPSMSDLGPPDIVLGVPSTVKETPSGWLISSGLRSVRELWRDQRLGRCDLRMRETPNASGAATTATIAIYLIVPQFH